MMPTNARKGPNLYRYYLSRALIEGTKDQAGSIKRVSAPPIESAVVSILRKAMDAALSDKQASAS